MQNRGSDDEHLAASQAVVGQVRERWLRHYVGGKLRSDPVFPMAFELFAASPLPILDVGCGVGLLGFYLRARGCGQPVLGVDRDARKIARAREMADVAGSQALEFRADDVRHVTADFLGNVAVFDVLHYLSRSEQHDLLVRLAQCVSPDGMLVIRDAPRDQRPRFWLTFLAEIFAQTITWNVRAEMHFPSRDELARPFPAAEFSQEARPLWGRTPFNNHVFIFRRELSAIVPREE